MCSQGFKRTPKQYPKAIDTENETGFIEGLQKESCKRPKKPPSISEISSAISDLRPQIENLRSTLRISWMLPQKLFILLLCIDIFYLAGCNLKCFNIYFIQESHHRSHSRTQVILQFR
jgi:hypothetical protein